MVTALTGYCGVACRQRPPRVPCRVPAGLVFGGSLPHNGASTRKWRNGRRAVFRWQCPYGRGGSNPPLRTERERPRHAFRRGLSRSSGMWIWEPPQRSEDGGVPPCAREDEGPRTSRFGALRAFVGGPWSCLGEESPVSRHLKILIEDCLLTQGAPSQLGLVRPGRASSRCRRSTVACSRRRLTSPSTRVAVGWRGVQRRRNDDGVSTDSTPLVRPVAPGDRDWVARDTAAGVDVDVRGASRGAHRSCRPTGLRGCPRWPARRARLGRRQGPGARGRRDQHHRAAARRWGGADEALFR